MKNLDNYDLVMKEDSELNRDEVSQKREKITYLTDNLYSLTPRQQEILVERFGLNDGKPKTFAEVSDILSIKNSATSFYEALKRLDIASRKNQNYSGLPQEVASSPYEILDETERNSIFKKSIASLTEEQKDIIQQRFYLGYSYQKIAERLKVDKDTVRKREIKAVKKLKETFDSYDFSSQNVEKKDEDYFTSDFFHRYAKKGVKVNLERKSEEISDENFLRLIDEYLSTPWEVFSKKYNIVN